MKLSELKLLEPKKDNIVFFNALWGKKSDEHALVEGGELVTIDRNVITDLDTLNKSEKLLNAVFDRIRNKVDKVEKTDIREAVYLLDAIYHTSLKHHIIVADSIYNGIKKSNLLRDILDVNDPASDLTYKCVDNIACAGKKVNKNYNYAYSFATKFCSWLNPETFVIFDNIAANLLAYYSCDNKNEIKDIVKSYGKYGIYVSDYKNFVENKGLNQIYKKQVYKKVDVFMWTYGKALQKIENPKFENSPQYKPIKY